MPLMPGHSKEVVGHNIKEMIKAGHPKKQAIAASLANARKHKKMADGGMVDDSGTDSGAIQSISYDNKPDKGHGAIIFKAEGGMVAKEGDYDLDEEHERGIYDLMKQGDQPPVANPEEEDMEKHLAMMLHKYAEDREYMAMGGYVEPDSGDETPEVFHDGTEEPMNDEPAKAANDGHAVIEGVPEVSPSPLSEEAKKALALKKKMRRFK